MTLTTDHPPRPASDRSPRRRPPQPGRTSPGPARPRRQGDHRVHPRAHHRARRVDGDEHVLETPDGRGRYRFRARELALEHLLIDRSTPDARARRPAARPRRPGVRRRVRRGARHPAGAAADVPRGGGEHARLLGLEAPAPRTTRRGPRGRELPGGRGGDDRGTPRLRRQQRPRRVRARRLRALRAGDRSRRSGWCGWPAVATPAGCRCGEGLDRGRALRRRARRGGARAVRRATARARASTPRTTCGCRCTRGSGPTRSRSPSRPTWRAATWCSSGRGPTTTAPQQSIRTFFNTSRPDRHYTKTALSVQNMGFMRGLSPAYMGGHAGHQRLGARGRHRRPHAAPLRVHGAPRARGDRLHRRCLPPARRHLAVPEDARGAVAREPGAPARAGGAAGHDGGAAPPRRRRRLVRRRAGPALRD